MNTEYKLFGLGVHPEYAARSDVVAEVRWGIVSSRSGFSAQHFAQTLLPLGELSEFTPIDQLTKQQILDWAVAAEGGAPYLQHILDYQNLDLTAQERAAGVVAYTGTLAFQLDPLKNQHVTDGIQVTTV